MQDARTGGRAMTQESREDTRAASAGTVAGLVLAGGRSRRMGRDKAFAELGGRPLVAHALDLLRPHCRWLAISANADHASFAAFGAPVLADEDDSRPGPLAGLLSGLAFARAHGAEMILTVPVDVPFLPSRAPERLVGALRQSEALVAVARTGAGLEPLVAAWRPGAEPVIRASLEAGRRAVRDVLEVIPVAEVIFDAAEGS